MYDVPDAALPDLAASQETLTEAEREAQVWASLRMMAQALPVVPPVPGPVTQEPQQPTPGQEF
jgi:hypothetical protein